MLDIKQIREQPDFVKAELRKVGVDPADVDRVIEADARRRAVQHELDELRARRTRESKELGKASAAERDKKRAEMRELGDRITSGERDLAELERGSEAMLLMLPNMPRPFVPVGAGESENRIIRTEGKPAEFTSFKPLPHWELGE
ncbi:MAG TPA: hypothetical protein VIX12_05580, partial [Candidatus Binataceae bacterium]